jgi:hypothetical protein
MCFAPRARVVTVPPAAPVGACARPFNFTVRSHAGRFRVA